MNEAELKTIVSNSLRQGITEYLIKADNDELKQLRDKSKILAENNRALEAETLRLKNEIKRIKFNQSASIEDKDFFSIICANCEETIMHTCRKHK
jgi:hypothetical protein